MLDLIAAKIVDTLGEREFDAPFMALLRTAGFTDVHLTHGALEFGKDFVAKRRDPSGPVQFVFQSKAGDLSLSEWTKLQGQLTLLMTNTLSHPSFDSQLPRRAVLVITGRLNGYAQLAAQNFVQQVAERGETPLEIWDRERVIELMTSGLSAAIDQTFTGEMVAAYGEIGSGAVTEQALDRVSNHWCEPGHSPVQAALWATVLSIELERANRQDLACHVALALVRAAAYHTHGQRDPDGEWMNARGIGRLVFRTHALRLWNQAKIGDASAAGLVRASFESAAIVTYRVRCTRLVEFVALAGLMSGGADSEKAAEIAVWIAEFLGRHPGAHQPISDKWAVSFVPAVLLLCRHSKRSDAGVALGKLSDWVVRSYVNRLGLAGPRATPHAEISNLLGSAENNSKREESYMATLILDLAAFLEFRPLYSHLVREFEESRILPWCLTTSDHEDQYLLDGTNIAAETNIPYSADLPESGCDAASHLKEATESRYLDQVGRAWDHLAVSAVLRDRHFPSAWRSILQA